MKKDKKINKLLDFLLKEDNYIPDPQSSFEVRPIEQEKNISLDRAVDRYLIRYEKESIPTVDAYEAEMFESKLPNYKNVLFEALNEADKEDDNTESDTEAPDAGGELDNFKTDLKDNETDVGSAVDIGSAPTKKTEQEKQNIAVSPQINLQEFAKNVARLVNNYETLINPKEVILNRVENYIMTNYDQRTAQELMNILDTNYSLKTNVRSDENEQEVPTSYQAGALSTEG